MVSLAFLSSHTYSINTQPNRKYQKQFRSPDTMTAILCSRKRSFFDDFPSPSPLSKKLRCSLSSSSSPVRFSPLTSSLKNSSLAHLVAAFPHMDNQLIERVFDECGEDLDFAIRRLNDLCLASSDADTSNGIPNPQTVTPAAVDNEVDGGSSVPLENQLDQNNLPTDGAQWVELFVTEMMNASNLDDARARASRALETLEKSIVVRAVGKAAQSFLKETALLKDQMQTLVQENTILKRAVSIQHERQKDYEDKTRELQHLKQTVSQYQQQLSTLEMNNYALSIHLKQATHNSCFPNGFNRDVF